MHRRFSAIKQKIFWAYRTFLIEKQRQKCSRETHAILLEIMAHIVLLNFGNLLVLCIALASSHERNNVDTLVLFFKADCGLLFCTNDGHFCKTFGAPPVDGTRCGDRHVSSICGSKELYNPSLRSKTQTVSLPKSKAIFYVR